MRQGSVIVRLMLREAPVNSNFPAGAPLTKSKSKASAMSTGIAVATVAPFSHAVLGAQFDHR